MKINDDSDGEYTDTEPAAGTTGGHSDKTEPEGEFTDSDIPDENPADAAPVKD